MTEKLSAAFYDMDGTLVSTNLVHSFLFTTTNEPSIARTVVKTASALVKIPAFFAIDQVSRMTFNKILYAGYAGEYQDRLLELAEEHFEEVLKPNIFPGAYELLATGKKRGLRQVIVSGSLDFLVAPLARHLGFDDMITNRLQFRKGVATGELERPILAGANKARFLQEYAEKWNIDLLQSYGFSDSYSDYPMLAVVGHPAVVNPDVRLRLSARELSWPILDIR